MFVHSLFVACASNKKRTRMLALNGTEFLCRCDNEPLRWNYVCRADPNRCANKRLGVAADCYQRVADTAMCSMRHG